MNFKRIDDNTIRCIITQEDMKEYGIEIEDFFSNKGKIQDFLHRIVEKAVDEVGYEAKNGMLSMQVMPLPKNALAITFSDKPEIGWKEIFKQMKDIMGDSDKLMSLEQMNGVHELPEEEKAQYFDELMKSLSSQMTQGNEFTTLEDVNVKQTNKTENKKNPLRIFRFSSYKEVEQFCSSIPLDKTIKSDLYKDELEHAYYLTIEKSRLSVKNFDMICKIALEYASFVSDRPSRDAYIKEHYVCICNNKAIKVIRKFA